MEETTKRKILFIVTKSNFGGAQRYVFDLATNLPRDRFETLVAFGGQGELKEKLDLAGIKTISVAGLERDIGFFRDWKAFLNIYKVIRDIRPDIIHLNSPKAGGLGSLAALIYNLSLTFQTSKLPNLKTIFTAHGWTFKEKRRSLAKFAIETLSWITMLLCDTTIVVSQDDKEKVKNFPFVGKKIFLIHNGIGPQTFREKNEARNVLLSIAKTSPAEDALWIGSVAELHKNKGLEYAISAIKTLTENSNYQNRKLPLAYFIIGEGEERKNLERLITEEKLDNTVFLLGSQKQASQYMKAFDLFLLPSLKEGLPYALLEAGAGGLPTIATNVGGVAEVIDDMKSGIIIKEKRVKELAEALEFILSHKDKMEEFGAQLEKKVTNKFTLDLMLRQTLDLYQRTGV